MMMMMMVVVMMINNRAAWMNRYAYTSLHGGSGFGFWWAYRLGPILKDETRNPLIQSAANNIQNRCMLKLSPNADTDIFTNLVVKENFWT